MKLVIDSFAYQVREAPSGEAILHLQPLEDVEIEGEAGRVATGLPVVLVVPAAKRDDLATKIRGSGVRPASVSDMKGIVGNGERKKPR